FVSPDPFVTQPGYTQNLNRYAYVYNNPLSYVDPSGFEKQCHPTVLKEGEEVIIQPWGSEPIKYTTAPTMGQICFDDGDPGGRSRDDGRSEGGSGSGGPGSFDPSSVPV